MIRRKKITLICIGVLLFSAAGSMPAFSQSDRDVAIGWYVAPTFMTTSFFNFSQWDLLFGTRAVITFNDFAVGLTGSSSIMFSSLYESRTLDEKVGLMLYSGLFFEYTVMSEQRWHFSIPFELVVGTVNIGELTLESLLSEDSLLLSRFFFGVIPGINFDITVARFFVIGLHAGYRFAILDDSQGRSLNHYDIWGIQTGLVFRFGKFPNGPL